MCTFYFLYFFTMAEEHFWKIDWALTEWNWNDVKWLFLNEHVQNFNKGVADKSNISWEENETQQAVEDVVENLESTYPEDLEQDILNYITTIDSTDNENEANLKPILKLLENDILDNICIIIKNALEKWLTIPQFNAICMASLTEWSVDVWIRSYLPEERFNEDGKVEDTYRKIFSPMSNYSLYIKIINKLDNNK